MQNMESLTVVLLVSSFASGLAVVSFLLAVSEETWKGAASSGVLRCVLDFGQGPQSLRYSLLVKTWKGAASSSGSAGCR